MVKENLKDGHNIFQVDKVKVKGKKLGVKIYRADLKPLNKKYMETYEKGLNLYMKGAFNLAISYFEEALTFFPDDKASSLMKERCLEFMEKHTQIHFISIIAFSTTGTYTSTFQKVRRPRTRIGTTSLRCSLHHQHLEWKH